MSQLTQHQQSPTFTSLAYQETITCGYVKPITGKSTGAREKCAHGACSSRFLFTGSKQEELSHLSYTAKCPSATTLHYFRAIPRGYVQLGSLSGWLLQKMFM